MLSENESFDLLKVCVNSVLSLPPETHTPEKTKEEDILDPKQRKVKQSRRRCVHTHIPNLVPHLCFNTVLRRHTKLWKMHTFSAFYKCNLAVKLTCTENSIQALYKDTLAALQELLKSVLARDPTPDGLQSVFKVRNVVSD